MRKSRRPHEAEQGPPSHRTNVAASQPPPDGFEFEHALQGRSASIVSAVDGAHTRTHHHVGRNAVGGKGMHHAHLNRAEATAACENERSLPLTLLGCRRQSAVYSLAHRDETARHQGAYNTDMRGVSNRQCVATATR